jgi:transaldolase
MSPWHYDALMGSTDIIPKNLDATLGMSHFSTGPLVTPNNHFRKSQIAAQAADKIPKVSFIDNEPEFRWDLLQDQVAFDKLHEGIKKFAEDGDTLKSLLRAKISGSA